MGIGGGKEGRGGRGRGGGQQVYSFHTSVSGFLHIFILSKLLSDQSQFDSFLKKTFWLNQGENHYH